MVTSHFHLLVSQQSAHITSLVGS